MEIYVRLVNQFIIVVDCFPVKFIETSRQFVVCLFANKWNL